MKKILSFVLWWFVAFALTCSVVFATDIEELLESLLSDIADFGYDSKHQLSVWEVSNSYIKFKSPIIQNDLWEDISEYIMLFWEKSIDGLIDIDSINDYTEVSFSPDATNGEIIMELNKSKQNIDPNKLYYAVVVPQDDYWFFWNKSNEICFKLSNQFTWSGMDCDGWTSGPTTTHTQSSWRTALDLANVSCTWDWKKVTLNWVPSDLWEVYISLYNEKTQAFDRKWSVNVSNQRTFSFNVTQSTAPIARFDDSEWLQAYKTYTCHSLQTSDTPTTPQKTWSTSTITKVPTVWPKENALAVAIGAVVLYLVYRVVRRKAD